MNGIIRAAIKWHPVMVLVAYAVFVGGYHRYLDADLNFIRPNIPAAPEDILGLGFWVTWLIIVWFGIASAMSYRLGHQHRMAWLPLLGMFLLLSVLDFSLYHVLERQVIRG